MSMTSQKKQPLTMIAQNFILGQIYHLERERVKRLITLAGLQDGTVNRWQAYECLKRMASRIVGDAATNDKLRSSQHYHAMIEFIDWLLPEEDCGCGEPVGFTDEDLRGAPVALNQAGILRVVHPLPEDLA